MDAVKAFLVNNRNEAVEFFKNNGVLTGRSGYPALIKMHDNGEISDEQLMECATALGYDPDAEPSVAENIAVPSDVKVLQHVTEKGDKVNYALLPLIRLTPRYAVCKYGSTELYVALSDEAVVYFLNRKVDGNPVQAGELIPAILSSGTDRNGYPTGLFKRPSTDKVMPNVWETKFLSSVHEGCLEVRNSVSDGFTRAEKIAVLKKQNGLSHNEAVAQYNASIEKTSQELLQAMSSSTSSLTAKLLARK